MDGANADSDHSMTWEDFFGSTTDLTPTLIGIYDSLREPSKNSTPEVSRFDLTAKDARNDPPLEAVSNPPKMVEEATKVNETIPTSPSKDPSKIAGSVKLPCLATMNKSSLYTLRTKVDSDITGANDTVKCNLNSSDTSVLLNKSLQRTLKSEPKNHEVTSGTFDNLSPNVKRMISSATDATNSTLKLQKKTASIGRPTGRHRSNIPLVGATSKIAQSRVEITSSAQIYDSPTKALNMKKEEPISPKESPSKIQKIKPDFKLNVPETYDVPTNNRPLIYDVPASNKTAFESLSLPYIDQSIELSVSTDDREFDTKLSSKDNSPEKSVQSPEKSEKTPEKTTKTNCDTNSLLRKDYETSPAKQRLKSQLYKSAVESTGHLKSVPDKEAARLNPPTLEVSRPLSMSSIASSSSTSSSGVQNKGGVNSAYLASIESLDDHSDADATSANGSNNFVNNAGVNKSASDERRSDNLISEHSDEMSGLSQLERVCAEILHTENVYVQDLQQVVEGYLHVWKREVTFSEEELSDLFNNIEDIYNFNRTLYEELNTCNLDATCIARCFVDNTLGFSVYTSYCTGYPKTMERLAALASNNDSAREFRERQLALGHPLPLASYLLKPVQRILKYHLLLQNVVKQCSSRDTEFALLKMTGIAQHIDDMKRRHEHAVRVQEIQSLLYGWNGPDLTTYGELCAEGTFRVFGAKAMRHAFLFDKMLLVTKNREDGILAYKSHIMCNNMMLVESIAGAPLSFHVIPWDAPRRQLTLQARSTRHKREWTLLLKRVILENYNAVIPSHARQLVMELGQNKTDDDILAEKSHNLITQASMRKQLSAPEYLEKRKLERDRRKSFENGVRGRLKKANRKNTLPSRIEVNQECDCSQVSADKGIDYTCDLCYVDLCSDCETEGSKEKADKCNCRNDDEDKCAECDRILHYIDGGSVEQLERKPSLCKCSDFKSSQESFSSPLNKRGYHSSDNIVGYTEGKTNEYNDTNNSMTNVRNLQKTCLKCSKIKENIVVTDSTSTIHSRKSRCCDLDKRSDTLRSKSKEDPQRTKLSKIGTWRRKSEPGLQNNNLVQKKLLEKETERTEGRGIEKIEFECRNCGTNKMSRKGKGGIIISDPEVDGRRRGTKPGTPVEIRMYNTKNVPKKISKLKKNRAKGLRLGSDTTAKFYADFSTDVSTENILHISESNDSLNIIDKIEEGTPVPTNVPDTISKDEDIDEETYKKLIEKTDSFKKNELEKVKYLNKQKVISEGSEIEDKDIEAQDKDVNESCEETEQPLEQIISQLLMQNREFQKLLKKQQQRNSAHRRHQRLLKSHSNPEPPNITKHNDKLKPKFGRQHSENLSLSREDVVKPLSPPNEEDDVSDDDHIYETLRVVEKKPDIEPKTVSNQIARPSRLPSPPKSKSPKDVGIFESDYVYLTFNKLTKTLETEGIYEVPVKSPEKVQNDYYVTVEKGPVLVSKENIEELYDNIIEVCRRKKEPVEIGPSDYLPMSPDSPNTPEIWLSRQKEHFNVSRDRKSGSLPRSFQVVSGTPEENNLSTFKSKTSGSGKTYLNRDGKVMSTDRPFTIASDQSELSYDDVENYMSEGDILKFNKCSKANDSEYSQDISQSTLELEQEIDRCYKNNFEAVNLNTSNNDNLLNVSQPNLDASTSSCEVLSINKNENMKAKEITIIHPEHKIYKPTSNMRSLKNVLSRFKGKNISKSTEEAVDTNSNEQSSPDSGKSELKSPTTEKKSALNPRSYSKNLLQRFRSIIGDEHTDDNGTKNKKQADESQNNIPKSDIKVVITTTDNSPTTSSITYTNNDSLSKSVYEQTTLTESQIEKNNLEELSHSCDNLPRKPEDSRPVFEKSVSLITSHSSSSATGSPMKSNSSSYQSINKLPIYMQGSKHLGARIAQSDYIDPTTLLNERSNIKSINVLINKNAVRPDSLFSNSSFVTSSSEGNYESKQVNGNVEVKEAQQDKPVTSPTNVHSDESYYERSFEKIEHMTDDVFRDSAVYSDQEDDESKAETQNKEATSNKTVKTEILRRNSSITKSQKMTITSTVSNTRSSTQSRLLVNKSINRTEKNYTAEEQSNQSNVKTKLAPPVPVKPKITSIPTTTNFQRNVVTNRSYNVIKTQHQTTNETNTIKRTASVKPVLNKPEISGKDNPKNKPDPIKFESKVETANDITDGQQIEEETPKTPTSNIQIKRLSFERASFDSSTRKSKSEIKNTTNESQSVRKSVLERRMELESLTKTQIGKTSVKKPSQIAKPKLTNTKVAPFERSKSDSRREIMRDPKTTNTENPNIPNEIANDIVEGSWVKTVVNKFQ